MLPVHASLGATHAECRAVGPRTALYRCFRRSHIHAWLGFREGVRGSTQPTSRKNKCSLPSFISAGMKDRAGAAAPCTTRNSVPCRYGKSLLERHGKSLMSTDCSMSGAICTADTSGGLRAPGDANLAYKSRCGSDNTQWSSRFRTGSLPPFDPPRSLRPCPQRPRFRISDQRGHSGRAW